MARKNSHEEFMRRALRLASRSRGKVESNPMVGAVLVKGGKIIGEGYHKKFGGPHAEIEAITATGDNVRGATLYVTLEPCAHFGKTPPCARAIINAGIKTVVIAVGDPFPETNGRGFRKLRTSGIEVIRGVCEDEARELNAPYFKLIRKGMPYVTAKWAMTLDGKIAARTGDSKWISSEASRRFAHRLRGYSDVVMVGVGTALADDPLLTCRVRGGREPKRLVVDSHCHLPLGSKLVRTCKQSEVIVATTCLAEEVRCRALTNAGCAILEVPEKDGRADLNILMETLGMMKITNVLIEGGGKLLGSAFDAGLVDKVCVFIAPRIVGGEEATTPVAGVGVERIAHSLKLVKIKTRRCGPDILIEGVVGKPSARFR